MRIVFRLKINIRVTAILLCMISAVQSSAQNISTELDDILRKPFPYAATNVDINRVVVDLGTMAGIPVLASEDLEGIISVSNPRGAVEDALLSIADQVPIVWWFDGAAVRIEPQNQMTSKLVSLGQTQFQDFISELRAMSLYDGRFAIRPASSGGFVRMVAPAGYVAEAELLIDQMNAPRNHQVCQRQNADGSINEIIVAGLPIVLRGQQKGQN